MTATYTEQSISIEEPTSALVPHAARGGVATARRVGLIITLTMTAGLKSLPTNS
jgi:hypothetical protein